MAKKSKVVRRNTSGSKQVSKITEISTHAMKTMSAMLSRAQLAVRAGLRFDNLRDYYSVFGWKTNLNYMDYLAKYVRQDIVSRIIDAPPGATWSNPPTFKNEGMQTAWNELDKEHHLWNKLQRVDRLSRIGACGLLVFGFNNSGLNVPLSGGKQELLYVRPISIGSIKQIKIESDSTQSLFGKPVQYTIKRQDRQISNTLVGVTSTSATLDQVVHASKVVHVVENALEDEIFGIPVIERCFNVLDDLLKVVGGSSETFWTIGNRGMHLNIDKEMDLTPEDEADLSDEIDEYNHGLRRMIRTRGVDIKDLGSSTNDPTGNFNMLISIISGTTGIPRRILIGAEAGQLASEQDRANWADRIEERTELHCEPNILLPVIDILQKVKLLPEGDPEIEWPSAFKMSPLEKSIDMAQKARAIGNISRQTGNGAPMQLTSRTEAREIIGLEGDLQDSELILPPEGDDTPSFGDDDDDAESKEKKANVDEEK